MLYVSLAMNLALAAALAYLWLQQRDQKGDTERTAREFELMLQAERAEQRTELLEVHARLMQAQQQLRQLGAPTEPVPPIALPLETVAD